MKPTRILLAAFLLAPMAALCATDTQAKKPNIVHMALSFAFIKSGIAAKTWIVTGVSMKPVLPVIDF